MSELKMTVKRETSLQRALDNARGVKKLRDNSKLKAEMELIAAIKAKTSAKQQMMKDLESIRKSEDSKFEQELMPVLKTAEVEAGDWSHDDILLKEGDHVTSWSDVLHRTHRTTNNEIEENN